MNVCSIPGRRSILAKVIGEFERGRRGQPLYIAPRVGPEWTEDRVQTTLTALVSRDVVGHEASLGFWGVA